MAFDQLYRKNVRTARGDLFGERLRCEVCDRPLYHPRTVGRKRRTCSDRCRQKLSRQKKSVKNFFCEMVVSRNEFRPDYQKGLSQLVTVIETRPNPNVR